MSSPQLVAQSNRTISEADIRALALAKAKAEQAYIAVWGKDTRGFTEEQLINHELKLIEVSKAMCAAARAFNEAV